MTKMLILYLIFFITPYIMMAQNFGEVRSYSKIIINKEVTRSYGSSVVSLNDTTIAVGSSNSQWDGEVFIHTLSADGTINSTNRITRNEGGFGDHHIFQRRFGAAVANAGDINGNGINDLIVGEPNAGGGKGAIWFLKLNELNEVIGYNRLSDTSLVLQSQFNIDDRFGYSIANIGDITGNGFDDIMVGAPFEEVKAFHSGSVYLLFMRGNGVVDSMKKFNDLNPAFEGSTHTRFGTGIAMLGDIASDGTTAIAVGESGFSSSRGAVWILFLRNDGSIESAQRITQGEGGFTGSLNVNSNFGFSLTNLGDIDGDGIPDIAVGEFGHIYSDSTGTLYGRVWILMLNSDGTVKNQVSIGNGTGNFTGAIHDGDRFGWSVARLPDLDGDGVPELAVGATGDNDPDEGSGAVYILFLEGVPQDVGVREKEKAAYHLRVHPNPASGMLRISLEGKVEAHKPVNLKLYDTLGRLVKQEQQVSLEGEFLWDVSDLKSSGVYFLTVEFGNERVSKKVVLE